VPSKVRRHLDTCARCRATWESTQSVHSDMTSLETDVPEPDWDHFRSSVRDQLLSRSIQRESTVRRWTGWSIRPAAVWAFSLFLAVGVTTVTVLWELNYPASTERPPVATTMAPVEPLEAIDSSGEKSLFDDVVSLGEEQQEQFRQMLESAQKGLPSVQ